MSSSFHLGLDTHAPVVTFGSELGLVAGELYRLAYTIDEPGVVSATLHLIDGRDLAMSDTGTEFQVLLPPDTPTGAATVHVLVRDDVLNSATRDHSVLLEGVEFVAPVYRSPGASPGLPTAPSYPRRPERKVVTSRTMIHGSCSMRVRARSTIASTATATTTAMIHATSATRTRPLVRTGARVQVHLHTGSAISLNETVAIRKHPEGPGEEEWLLLHGIL